MEQGEGLAPVLRAHVAGLGEEHPHLRLLLGAEAMETLDPDAGAGALLRRHVAPAAGMFQHVVALLGIGQVPAITHRLQQQLALRVVELFPIAGRRRGLLGKGRGHHKQQGQGQQKLLHHRHSIARLRASSVPSQA